MFKRLPLLCAGDTCQGQQSEECTSEPTEHLHIYLLLGLRSSIGGFGRELQHVAATDKTCESNKQSPQESNRRPLRSQCGLSSPNQRTIKQSRGAQNYSS